MAKSDTGKSDTGKPETANLPHILLLGGDGGYSGVPTYLGQLCRALTGLARFSIIADRNEGGYDFATDDIALNQVVGMKTGLSLRRFWRAMQALNTQITTDAPDLVWAHARMSLIQLRLLMIWRALRRHPPVDYAVTYHGLPFGQGHRRLWAAVSYGLEMLFLRLAPAHHIHFLSQGAADYFCDRMGAKVMARHRVHVLNNCSDLGVIAPPPQADQPTLVMAGRVSYQKNHAAAAALLAALPADYELILCGGGTEAANLAPMFDAQMPGLSKRVHFLGPRKDVGAVLARGDLFLLPSHYEGMPIAALEGFEMGLPMALSDIAGMGEILSVHPMAIAIDPNAAENAAAEVTALITRFRSTAALRGEIQTAWAAHFSYEAWQPRARAMVAAMLAAVLDINRP